METGLVFMISWLKMYPFIGHPNLSLASLLQAKENGNDQNTIEGLCFLQPKI